ncbi:MAG: HPF/RaiA family ribosome-associated protein [Steroidobacteraceae bacterium]
MLIQINTDHNLQGHEPLNERVHDIVVGALNRFRERITRVEVHLSDENGGKTGQLDKRCMIEARLEGRNPVAVTHHAATISQAIDGATDKLTVLIDKILGKLHNHRDYAVDPIPPESTLPEA